MVCNFMQYLTQQQLVAKGSWKHFTTLFWGVGVNRSTNMGKRDKIEGIEC